MTLRSLLRHCRRQMAGAFVVAMFVLLAASLIAQTVSPTSIGPLCTDFPVSITLPPSAVNEDVDVFFLVDDTNSFEFFAPLIGQVFGGMVSSLDTALPSVNFGFGAGRLEDFGGPGGGFSSELATGRPFILNQPIITTQDAGGVAARNALLTTALARTAPGVGGDAPEASLEALFQVATGAGFDGDGTVNGTSNGLLGSGAAGSDTAQLTPGTSGDIPPFSSNVLPHSGSLGGVGWRPGALHLLLIATDRCSVAAFPPNLLVPANSTIPPFITNAAGVNIVSSAFSCTATLNPGSLRWGFVSDALTTALNTIKAANNVRTAIAPRGAATVQATVDALNALGIRVLGMGPGAQALQPAQFAPGTAPSTWLSAMGYLTGGVDAAGAPLVFNVGTNPSDPTLPAALTSAILSAITTSTARPIDISLTRTTPPAGLTVTPSPAVRTGISPGGTASFNVAMSGNGTTIEGGFDLNFLDDNSKEILGTIPVLVSCTVPIDLSLSNSVSNAAPALGSNVDLTVVLANAPERGTATSVTVSDLLPAGLSFVSATPSKGSYNEHTGIWTVGTLASSAVESLVITAKVTSAGAKTSLAQVQSAHETDVDSTPGNAATTHEDDDESVTLTPVAIDLSLTKTVSEPAPAYNGDAQFTITVSNASGLSAATGVTVKDVLPAGLTYVSSTASQGSYDLATGIWSVGSLASPASATLTMNVTVKAVGAITNLAQVQAADQADVDSVPGNAPGTHEDDDASATVTATAVDLSLTKSVNTPTPALGGSVQFTLTVSNGSNLSTATGVSVKDVLPAGLAYVSSTASSGSYESSTGIWTIGALASPSTASLTITATVGAVGAITNMAQVQTADQTDIDSSPGNAPGTHEDDDASATVTATAIDLSLTKTVDVSAPAYDGGAQFTITVSNASSRSTATGVVVKDVLPAGLTYVSSTPSQGSYDPATGIWSVGTLASPASATLTIGVTVKAVGPIANLAQVQAADQVDTDSTPGNAPATQEDDDASATVTATAIDLSLTKSVSDATPVLGGSVQFTVTVSNASNLSTATGVSVKDVLPSGLTYLSSTASIGTYDAPTGIWTVGTLSSSSSATLTITAAVGAVGEITNLAQVQSADQPDLDSLPGNAPGAHEDDDAQASLMAIAIDLSLTKSVDTTTPALNGRVQFTVTVSNAAGLNTATGVSVKDLLPAGLTFVTATPGQGTYDASAGVWTVGTLTGGSAATLTIVTTVTSVGVIANLAQVQSADQVDVDSTPGNAPATHEDDDAAVSVAAVAIDLSLTKTVDHATPGLNSQVVFTISVSNAGELSTATGVVVRDVLPAGLLYVSSVPSVGSYDSATGAWTIGSIPSPGSASLTVTATVITAGAKTNLAQVQSADQIDRDSTPGNAPALHEDDDAAVTVTPVAVGIDLSLTKVVSNASPAIGATVTFTIAVSNGPGLATATGVSVKDVLPDGLTYVSSVASKGAYDGLGFWTVGTLASPETASLTITAKVMAAGTFRNLAQVQTAGQVDVDSTPGNAPAAHEDDDATASVTAAPVKDDCHGESGHPHHEGDGCIVGHHGHSSKDECQGKGNVHHEGDGCIVGHHGHSPKDECHGKGNVHHEGDGCVAGHHGHFPGDSCDGRTGVHHEGDGCIAGHHGHYPDDNCQGKTGVHHDRNGEPGRESHRDEPSKPSPKPSEHKSSRAPVKASAKAPAQKSQKSTKSTKATSMKAPARTTAKPPTRASAKTSVSSSKSKASAKTTKPAAPVKSTPKKR